MTKTEIDEISLITKKPMKILHKGIEITPFQKRDIKLPIKIIYAGGHIYRSMEGSCKDRKCIERNK